MMQSTCILRSSILVLMHEHALGLVRALARAPVIQFRTGNLVQTGDSVLTGSSTSTAGNLKVIL